MTIRELIAALAKTPDEELDGEIKVWLPGTTISLVSRRHLIRRRDCWAVEGNIDEGSVLHG